MQQTSKPFFKGYAVLKAKGQCVPFRYEPRPLGAKDVEVHITHSGICYSDIHQIDEGWGKATFPMVPGHEIIGNVTAVGSEVKHFKVGQRVGVGTSVLSCFSCKSCKNHNEQYCSNAVDTYNAKYPDGEIAFGGYAEGIRAHEHFVFAIPEQLSSAGAAPLLCAGVTTYTPFVTHHVRNKRVGVVGMGGLGHLGVKWSIAFGNETTVISHSESKKGEAEKLGAKFLVMGDDVMKHAQAFDFLLITANHSDFSLAPYLELLDVHGVACVVGLPEVPTMLELGSVVSRGRIIAGSMTGSPRDTQEMLEFAAKHKIEADVEVFALSEVNRALQGVREGKPRFRYVLDTAKGLEFAPDQCACYEHGKGVTFVPDALKQFAPQKK